jgi:hypothetical protein
MNKTEILQHIAYNHNILADMLVKGDNAISVGKVLEGLRAIAAQLQEDIQSDIDMAQVEVDHSPMEAIEVE